MKGLYSFGVTPRAFVRFGVAAALAFSVAATFVFGVAAVFVFRVLATRAFVFPAAFAGYAFTGSALAAADFVFPVPLLFAALNATAARRSFPRALAFTLSPSKYLMARH